MDSIDEATDDVGFEDLRESLDDSDPSRGTEHHRQRLRQERIHLISRRLSESERARDEPRIKMMKLSQTEIDVINERRRDQQRDVVEAMAEVRRAECDHDWVFDFQNYKTCYYRCGHGCGARKTR